MRTFETPEPVHEFVRGMQRDHETVALIPTMGALHEGHLSLIRTASEMAACTLVTVFVNPTQFGPNEDLSEYPRSLQQDLEKLDRLSTSAVFTPKAETMYPAGFSTYVKPPSIAEDLEGRFRPEHFQGVTTIVLKLFQIAPADIAFFGQKDYQQCLVIRDMVRDLNIATRLRFCPTIREPDGLATSSRNQFLSPEAREQALGLSRALQAAQNAYAQDEHTTEKIEAIARAELQRSGIEAKQIDYVTVRDGLTLQPTEQANESSRLLIAARVGSTRLIDNASLERRADLAKSIN